MEVFIHAANVVFLASYLVRDILWLRCFTVLALGTLTVYFAAGDQVVWAAIIWNTLFIGINLFQIYLLLLQRRPVALSEGEQNVYDLAFRTMTPREFKRLAGIGQWCEAAPSERLVTEGQDLDRMMVICTGGVSVEVDGKQVARLGGGSFVGEMSYLTDQAPAASVSAAEPTRYLCWPTETLRSFLRQHPELRAAWQRIIGADLATKLKASG